MCTLSALALTIMAAGAEPAWWAPLGGSISLDAAVGSGTFVAHDKADDPYYASTLAIAPSWSFDDHLALSLSASFSYEWTYLVTPCSPASGPRPAGAPQQDCSDTNDPNGRRATMSDIELSIAHDRLLAIDPLALSAWAAVALPTSRESRHTDNLFTLGAGGSAKLAFAPVEVGVSLGLHKFFPIADAAVLDAAEAEVPAGGGVPRARCAAGRSTACLLLSGFVPDWRASAGLSVSSDIPLVPGLSASVALEYAYSRRFGRDPDAFSSTRTDANGERIVDGVNGDDTTAGTIELGYAIDEHVSIALGVSSVQPARTADGSALRFPFYDFISPAQNYSTWYLSGTFSL